MEKKKNKSSMPRLTVRLNPNQMQVLYELTDALGATYSQLIRAIILDFLSKNEDLLEGVIERKQKLKINDNNNEEDE